MADLDYSSLALFSLAVWGVFVAAVSFLTLMWVLSNVVMAFREPDSEHTVSDVASTVIQVSLLVCITFALGTYLA